MSDDEQTKNDSPKPLRRAQIQMAGDSPVAFSDDVEATDPGPTESQRSFMSRIGKTLAAYSRSAKTLLDGRLSHLRDYAPAYLSDPGNVLIVSCEDGVVVRYERRAGNEIKRVSAWMPGDVGAIALLLSQGIVRCHASGEELTDLGTHWASVTLAVGDRSQTMRFVFVVALTPPLERPMPPAKPFCLLSIRNEIEVNVFGEIGSVDQSGAAPAVPFIAQSILRLPFGWECIEVFPFIDLDQWKPEYAETWAERDILAAVVAHHLRAHRLNELDPKADARRQFAELLGSFRALLDRNPEREEELQVFLAENPILLCPTHTSMWPKLALGAFKTDFVFREAAGDYLLVEIEKSTLRLFRNDGQQTAELTHAHGQIRDWKRYIEDNLSTVQRELGLTGLSSHPRSLIVIGRSSMLDSEDRRRLTTIENESPKLKIMTYDDVLVNATAVAENILGPLWNVSGNTQILYPKQHEPLIGQQQP